jgi:hypothetical protein
MTQSRNTLKNWFKKGLKPLEVQFADWIDSYWHKDDAIPIEAIAQLQELLNAMALAASVTTAINSLRDEIKGNAPADGDSLEKLYNLVTSVGEFVDNHDASAGLPVTGSGLNNAIDKGDYWIITAPGNIVDLGDLAPGDLLFARVSGATDPADFFYLPFASLIGNADNDYKGIAKLFDAINIDAPRADGSLSEYAAINAFIPKVYSQDISGAVIIDLAGVPDGSVFQLTLTANVTSFGFTNARGGFQYIFVFLKTATEKTLVWDAGLFKFPFGNAPVLTNPTANGTNPEYSEDVITALAVSADKLSIVYTPDFIAN